MKQENKECSIKYWDQHASNWEKIAYDKKEEYLRFPSSQQRQDITIKEIEKHAKTKKASIIDIGCADGELVRALVKQGFTNVCGVDNSKNMIELAKKKLKQEGFGVEPNEIFFVDDADHINQDEEFDFVTAMGLIEYVLDLNAFFVKLRNLLKREGCAYIESRNKLFNLFSSNKYTCESSIDNIVEELGNVERFSPVTDKNEIENIVAKSFISISKNLEQYSSDKTKELQKFEKFPFALPQFTPLELEVLCKKHGLNLKHVIYYHVHPFLPKFESDFPRLFNRIARFMKPLGYTPLGAAISSAFIAVIEKR